ncbi:unnamed protein product [Parnassius apollo]|uniref:(apollo) hypothetical protein n=1 Tax=Parnassius apollo TaxID=110799 RepID=A0A8S3WT46_PARAO|nr:unnamed protein product [Parnassius apollo]
MDHSDTDDYKKCNHANNSDIVLIDEVKINSMLQNIVTGNVARKDIENVAFTTDSKKCNHSNDGVSSSVINIDLEPQNTLPKEVLMQDTFSNANETDPDNNEDFSGTDGSEYEPTKKSVQEKYF